MPDYSRTFEKRRLSLLQRLIPAGSGRALDVGCFDGTTTTMLADLGYDATGVDLDADAIAAGAVAHPNVDLRAGAVGVASDKAPFALVTCLEVIEHVAGAAREALLAETVSMLDAGGVLVLSTPGRWSVFATVDRLKRWLRRRPPYDWWDPTHVDVMSWRSVRRLLGRHGLRVERVVGFLYLPLSIAKPFAIRRWPLNRAGFVLIVIARRHRRPSRAQVGTR